MLKLETDAVAAEADEVQAEAAEAMAVDQKVAAQRVALDIASQTASAPAGKTADA